MKYEYKIQTSIYGRFDPDVEGITLDSIITTCEGVEDYGIPFGNDFVLIKIRSERLIDENYLRRQLNDEFSEDGEDVIKSITRKTL